MYACESALMPHRLSLDRALKGEDMTVYGDGSQTRSFQVSLTSHVDSQRR